MPSSQAAQATALPRISVVIPAYNASVWIRETLQSVVEQRYPANLFEILVIDDGSTDGSAEIAESILASTPVRGRVIRTTRGGPSRARNAGWRQARGGWIQFLDADDLLHPEKMAVQAEATHTLSDQVAVVHSSWQILQRIEREWVLLEPVKSPAVDADPLADLLKPEGFVHTGSGLFRRDWLERVEGFDERHWLIEDVDLMLRIAMAGGEFRRVGDDQPLFFYRRDVGGSLSQQDRRGFLEGCVRNANLVECYCRQHGTLTAARAQAVASVYFQAARQFAEWDRGLFQEMVQKLEALCPGFRPEGPPQLRWLSGLIGYPRAEMAAVAWRKVRCGLGRRAPRTGPLDPGASR
jgi:hypothetical protein